MYDNRPDHSHPQNCQACNQIWQELRQLNTPSVNATNHLQLSHNNSPPRNSTASAIKSEGTETHMFQIILRELRIFCENTTIRGLPRIVRAHSRSLRMLWSSLVCILVLGCVICLLFLSRQYLEYNVIHPPRVLRHTSSPFPAATVCNLRPISPDGLRYLRERGWKTPRQFATDLAHYTQIMYYNKRRMKEYNAASAAFSLAGFLESLPNDAERRKLGYIHQKLIIKCQMTYLNGSKSVAAPCDSKGRWRRFIHAQYLNCATFEPSAELRDSTTNIELYFYLDEMSDYATCPDCFHGEVKSQLSGALIVIHPADHLPNVNDKSINLKPGSLTEIRLSIVENVQKMPPYGRCSLNIPHSLQLYDDSYDYSEYACREATIQNDITKRCGCYSMEYPYNENSGYEPCSRLSQFVNLSSCLASTLRDPTKNGSEILQCNEELSSFTKRMLCKRSVTENYVHTEMPSCIMPCAFYSYEAEQSTSSWPTKTWQLTWLNSSYNRRMGFFKGPEFAVYRQAQQLLASGNETGAAELLQSANLLERNLLAVLINRPNFDVRKVEEKEVLSLTSFLSQSGGLFSIWMGLSMISLGELMEFFMRCYVMSRNARRGNRSTTQSNPPGIDGRNGAELGRMLEAAPRNITCAENHPLWVELLALIKQRQILSHRSDDENGQPMLTSGMETHKPWSKSRDLRLRQELDTFVPIDEQGTGTHLPDSIGISSDSTDNTTITNRDVSR